MEKRCDVCNAELSACGEMTEDGPSDDCEVCQLRADLAAANERADSAEKKVERIRDGSMEAFERASFPTFEVSYEDAVTALITDAIENSGEDWRFRAHEAFMPFGDYTLVIYKDTETSLAHVLKEQRSRAEALKSELETVTRSRDGWKHDYEIAERNKMDRELERDEILRRAGLDCGCGQHHWVCHECVHKLVEAERDAMRGVIARAEQLANSISLSEDFEECRVSLTALASFKDALAVLTPPAPSGRDEEETDA